MLGITETTFSQTKKDPVKTELNNMFAGMKNANADLFKTVFRDSAIMQTISKNRGLRGKCKRVAKFVCHLMKDPADERITFEIIKIDGMLAIG